MSTPLLDPRQEFLAQDPTQLIDPNALSADTWAQIPMPERGQYRTFTDVSLGVGAAFYVLTRMVGNRLRTFRGRDLINQVGGDLLHATVLSATKGYRRSWNNMINPAMIQAFRLGTTVQLNPEDELAYATVFSDQVFDYINDTSANALVAAYQDQLAKKWNPDLAWLRAVNGYGLEQRSMSQYLQLLSRGEGREIIPTAARNFVQKALQQRGQRIGLNESFRAQELGKTLVWLTQYNKGLLPLDTQRRWLTAEDERVCAICGPMDRVQVPMEERFELPDGNKVWAPGIHPNCRCSVEITYPELIGKRKDWESRLHPRNEDGEFVETPDKPRRAQPPPREEEPEPAPSRRLAELLEEDPDPDEVYTPEQIEAAVQRGVITEEEAELLREEQITAPSAVTSPVTAPVTSPFEQAVTNPLEQTVTAPVTAPVSTPVTSPVTNPFTKVTTPVRQPNVSRRIPVPKHFLRPTYPLHVFANDLNQTLRLDRQTWLGDQTWDVGDEIDLNQFVEERDGAPSGVLAEAMPSNQQIARYASERYADSDNFKMWDQTEKSQYMAATKDFYERANENVDRIVGQFTVEGKPQATNQFTSGDLKSIFDMAGEHTAARTMPDYDLAEELKAKVKQNDTELQNVYLHYLEHVRPTLVSGSQELMALNYLMPSEPHLPTVLVFAEGADGAYIDGPHRAIITGRYKVKGSKIVPIKPLMKEGAPSNIAAIKLLYLEPVGFTGQGIR